MENDPPIASASPPSIAHELNASTNEIPAASTRDDPAVIDHISSVENITVTTYMWTNKQDLTSYLGVTIHFLHQDSMQAVTIGVFPVEEKHTASNIGQRLGQILREWSIPLSKITCIVTDGSKNMIDAITSLVGSNKHLTCYAHVLHSIVTAALSNAKDPEKGESVLDVVEKVKKIVRFFEHSSCAASKLKQIQGSGALKLKQSVPTGWNSTYYMIERFLKLAAKVSGVLMELPSDSVEMVSSAELEVLREVADSLKPFEQVCREISLHKYFSSSKVIPLASCVIAKISRMAPNTALGKSFKKIVEKEMVTLFANMEFSPILGISTLLDPRFKKLHFQNPLAVKKLVSYINDMLVTLSPLEAEEDILSESNFFWTYHARVYAKSIKDGDIAKKELLRYFLKPIPEFSNWFDPVKYWISESVDAPYLSQIALKYLTTVGSSVPRERLFSKAGQIASDSRN